MSLVLDENRPLIGSVVNAVNEFWVDVCGDVQKR